MDVSRTSNDGSAATTAVPETRGWSVRWTVLVTLGVFLALGAALIWTVSWRATEEVRTALLVERVESESRTLVESLERRVAEVERFTAPLLDRPEIVELVRARDVFQLNQSTLAFRYRTDVDIVQIRDAEGQELVDLTLGDIHDVSNLAPERPTDAVEVREVDGRLLVLVHHRLAEGLGSATVTLDVERELRALASRHGLQSRVSARLVEADSVPVHALDLSSVDAGRVVLREVVRLAGHPVELMVTHADPGLIEVGSAGRSTQAVGLLLSALVLLAGGYGLSLWLTRPLAELGRAADALRAGALDHRVPVPPGASRNELVALGQTFNGMAERLESLYEHLEEQVEARTRRIESAAEIARLASLHLGTGRVLQLGADPIHRRFRLARVALYATSGDAEELHVQARAGDADVEAFPSRVTHTEDGPVSEALRSKSPVQGVTARGTTLAAIPVVVEVAVVGMLVVETRLGNDLDGMDQTALRLLADQLAVAVRNADLLTAARREVQERVATERALRHSEERYRALFEADLTGDFVATPDGRIRQCNPAFLRIFGLASDAEAQATNLAELYGDEWLADVRALLRRDGRVEYQEVEPAARDGRRLHVIQNLVAVRDASGRPAEILGFVFDNTPLHLMQAQLRESQKLEAVGRLAGGIAHDFNNVLTAILGYAEMIQELPPGRHELGVRFAGGVVDACERAARLCDQLLTFSRRKVVQVVDLDAAETVRELEQMLRRLVTPVVSFRVTVEPESCLVRLAEGQLDQVLVNLVVNAVQAMPDGGSLTLTVERVAGREARGGAERWSGDVLRVQVQDTGTGIAPELLPRLFDPFFTTKTEGTGLGLSTSRAIVEQAGGALHVESRVGVGTSFEILLPALSSVAPRRVESPTPRTDTTGGERFRVLLVDDDDAVRAVAAAALRAADHVVVEASSLAAAERRYDGSDERFDALVTDVLMPGGGGHELARLLRTRRGDLPVVFVSGFLGDSDDPTGGLAPPCRFVPKPFRSGALRDAVRAVVADGRTTVSIEGGPT